MVKIRLAIAAMALASATAAHAGGINTNSNLSVNFARIPSCDAAIGIDGVYFNPAGVAFLAPGLHVSLNWQLVYQTRTIDNSFPLYARNTNDPTTDRHFKGEAKVPVFPSVMVAYNKGRFAFQFMTAVTGGGGKCTFDDGLGSFEKIVAETALASSGLAQTVDAALASALLAQGMPASQVQQLAGRGFSSDQYFGSQGNYSYDSYMRGRQYYYGVQLGAAYRVNPNLSVYAGLRGVYAQCNYYGYLRDIRVGNMPLYQVLDPSRPGAANVELNTDQSGLGFTPIIGVDYKAGRWNFAAKYEFKTRLRLKNEGVNQVPSIGNLGNNLAVALMANLQQYGLTAEQSQAVATATLNAPTVTQTMVSLKEKFDKGIEDATGEYEDGRKVPGDIPAILAVGVGYTPIDQVRLTAGFHYYFDKQARAYKDKQKKLDRGTVEYSFGVEYDPSKVVTVSAGYQRTSYGITNEYMDDKSFVVSSNSVGAGVAVRLSKKTRLNVAYFHSFYDTKKTTQTEQLTPTLALDYRADYTRTNSGFGVGLDIDF